MEMSTLGNAITVYVDPNPDEGPLVKSYKVEEQPEIGMFYCPYVPLMIGGGTKVTTLTPDPVEEVESEHNYVFQFHHDDEGALLEKAQEAFNWARDCIPKKFREFSYSEKIDIPSFNTRYGSLKSRSFQTVTVEISDKKFAALFKLLWL